MSKNITGIILLLICGLFTTISSAADQTIHVEWGYTPPDEPPLAGYALYMEGMVACTTYNPQATAMDCNVSLDKDTTNFTLTALFSDGSESPHSPPFPFSSSDSEVADNLSSDTASRRFTFSWDTESAAESYRIYINNTFLCETRVPGASTITCNADLIDGPMAFSMTEVSALGVESSHSNILVFDPTDYAKLYNPKKVELTWEYPDQQDLKGFRVYQNNNLLCETDDPAIRQLSCMANLTSSVVEFNITAVDLNNTETALSNTLTYTDQDQQAGTMTSEPISSADISSDSNTSLATTDTQDSAVQIGPLNIANSLSSYTSEDGSISEVTTLYQDRTTDGTIHTKQATTLITETTLSEQNGPVVAENNTPVFNLEVGEITIDAQWKIVPLAVPFQRPIVVAQFSGINESFPGIIHLRNITSTGFEICYSQQAGSFHGLDNVTVHYMVMEQGRFFLNQTTMVEAGSFSATSNLERISFLEPFTNKPIVFTTMASNNQEGGVDLVTTDVTITDFDTSLLLADETNIKMEDATVQYIAWEQGSGTLDALSYASCSYEKIDGCKQILTTNPAFLFSSELLAPNQEYPTHLGYLGLDVPIDETSNAIEY